MMIDMVFECRQLGSLSIKSSDISELFLNYQDIYSKVFGIDSLNLEKQKAFKTARGGLLVKVIKGSTLLGFYTVTNAEFDYLEFGDLIKVSKEMSRETFARAINISCKRAIAVLCKKGIYTYPNFYAARLLTTSGFNLISYYQRKIYLIISCLKIMMPIIVHNNIIHINKTINLAEVIQILNLRLVPTRLRLLNIRVFKKSNQKTILQNLLKFGFLYEYSPSKKEGDSFLVYNEPYFPLDKIDFHYTDNSA